MQFRDLQQQYHQLQPQIDEAIRQVNTSGAFIMGSAVGKLEEELAQYAGVKHCLTCANGTDALRLALMAWGIGQGDAVFVPDFTFFASAEVIALEGATPVFVDVDPNTFNIDPADLEQKITITLSQGILTPRAIIAVDLFGLPAPFDAIKSIAQKHQLHLLEDAAQGFGGTIGNRRACSFGDIAATSFFPAKPLGCYGDGGAVFTNDDQLADLISSLRQHGKGQDKYDNVRLGLNSRLDTLQAAILSVKLNAFAQYELQAVQQVAQRYTTLLSPHALCPLTPQGFSSSWAQYTLRLPHRNNIQAALKAQGIPSMVYYPRTMSQQTVFQHLSTTPSPKAKQLTTEVLSLPMHPYMTTSDIDRVAEAVITALHSEQEKS